MLKKNGSWWVRDQENKLDVSYPRFHKAVMDNAHGSLLDSYINFLFIQFQFLCLAASSWSSHWANHLQIHLLSEVTIQSRNGSFEFCRNSIKQTSKRWGVWLSHMEPIYWVSSLCQFSSDDPILWNADTYCLRHLSWGLMWVLFNKCFQLFVDCGSISSTLLIFRIRIPIMGLLKPAPYCLITSRFFTPSFVDISNCFRGIMTKLELMQKK